MHYIVLDLEFNQAFPFKTGEKTEPVEECPFEIIQIGAVKLDQEFNEIGTFNQMIQPQIYTRLHPFVEKITGIRESDFCGQPTFPNAYQAFLTFIGKEDAVLCTWGGDDIKSLFRNILYYHLDTKDITNRYLNIQTFASTYLKYELGKAIGLKNAVLELELDGGLPFHDALHDAIYTANIFRIVRPEKIEPSVFKPLTMLVKKPKPPRTNTAALFRHISSLLEREISAEERKLIKLSYFLGHAHTFDISTKKGKK